MKKITALSLLVALLLSLSLTAYSDTLSAPPAGQISADPNYAEFIWRAPSDLTRDIEEKKIIYIDTGISKVSSTTVAIKAITEANAKAITIHVNAVIQRWENNKWNNYISSNYGNFESSSHQIQATKTVEPGYYYRLACTHTAYFDNDDTSSYNSYTGSLYIN